jgi:hypothetical protein
MAGREVTERDFRMPEFRDAKVEDYEFRADGKLVRKDRWECAIGSIRHMVGVTGREFEIPDVVEAVRKMAATFEGWLAGERNYPDGDFPDNGIMAEIRLEDGSVLRNASYVAADKRWLWNGAEPLLRVIAWREQQDLLPDSTQMD